MAPFGDLGTTGSLEAVLKAWRQRDPSAPALTVPGATLSRDDLGRCVGDLARRIQDAGVRQGQVLAWIGLNSPELVAALLACETLGVVFMPLNWRLSDPELATQLRHAGAQALLASPDAEHRAQVLRAQLLPRNGLTRPDDLMLVYTSGTTGKPRGALHTRAAMLANARAAVQAQDIGSETRTLSVLPLFHVGGLCIQTLPTLLMGGCVNLPQRFEAEAWLQACEHWRPTTSVLVPAVMRALIEHPLWPRTDLSSLRFVNSGSSVIPLALIESFHARGVPVTQVYGSTETGPVSIVLRPEQARAHAGRAGWPALGVQVRLVRDDGTEVAAGDVGEILVRAPQLMRAYINEPPEAGFRDGWFATGDLGRMDASGCFEVVGRTKDMVITGGEKVYPAEIEALLEGFPGLAECAVVGLPDERWGEVPALALVPVAGGRVDLDALREFLAQRLARYKLPKRVVVLQALPKTALGKVQKTLLAQQLQPQG